jgi:hypothetical protein
MVRFLVILGVAAVVVVMFWPLLRKLDATRVRAEAAPPSRSSTLFLALALTLGLSFVISAALWYFGR